MPMERAIAQVGYQERLVPLRTAVERLAPGLLMVLLVAVIARVITSLNGFVPDVVVALLLGIVVSNSLPIPSRFNHGAKFIQRYLLRVAIILLGASLSLAAVLQNGGKVLFVIVACVLIAFSLCGLLARLAGLSNGIGTLLSAGTAICGATAILTIGPLIAATEAQVAYAVTTIFAYNALAVIFYPAIGHSLGLSALDFGAWAGTSINDTSAVIATGYIYGDAAGQVATIVKLTRAVLLVPLTVVVAMAYGMRQGNGRGHDPKINITKIVPWFILGFLAMALLSTTGILPTSIVTGLTDAAKFLIVMVLAAVGLGTNLAQMRKMGLKPLLTGLLIGMVMSVISLGLTTLGTNG